MHQNPISLYLALALWSLATIPLWSQAGSIFDRIYQGPEFIPHITITANWDSLEHRRQQQTPGSIQFEARDGTTETWPVRLEKRGRYRQHVCVFPPLKLDFKKGQLRRKGLSEHDDIKLVTHCVEDETGKEYLLREYLAYQLLHVLTERALRVQLVDINYLHQVSGQQEEHLGILIEDMDQLAERLRLKQPPSNRMGFSREDLDLECALRTSLFEYMIGNADWSLFLGRNVKMLQDTFSGRFHSIPYDFDFAGLVNASYAKPNTNHGQRQVTDRVYLGPPASRDEMEPLVEEFLAKREALENCVHDCVLLSQESKEEILAYLRDFFKEVKTRSFFKTVEQASPIENKF